MTPPELREKAVRLATLCDQVGTELKSAERHFYPWPCARRRTGCATPRERCAWQQARRQAAMTPDAIRARIRRLEAIAAGLDVEIVSAGLGGDVEIPNAYREQLARRRLR